MNEKVIRELIASIILNTYRNHCDKYNTLDDFIEEYAEILEKITPKLVINGILGDKENEQR